MFGAFFDDVAPDSVDEGDAGALRMSARRELYVQLRDAAGNERGLKVDANGAIAITGTVDLGATDNAVLDAIAASVAAIDTDATTIIGHVDGIEGLLTTIDADTGSILTSVQLLDDAIIVLGTATYTEAASTGFAIGAVRRDADTTLVNTTNEWGPLQMDANGRLKVEAFSGEALPVTLTSTTITGTVAVTQSGTWDEVGINDSGNSITVDWAGTAPPIGAGVEATALRVTVATDSTGVLSIDDNGASLTVDNGGTFAVQIDAGAVTSLALIDDIVYTDDTSTHATGTSKGALIMAAAAPTDAAVNANDIGAVGMTVNRELYVSLITALPAGTNNIGDVDVLSVNAFPAHDAAIAGNPLRIAGRALTADYTAVAAGDTADLITTLTGKLVTYPWANPNQNWSYAAPAGGLVTTTAVTIKAAAGAGIRNYITDIQVVNSHATVSTELIINDGAAGTVLWRGWLQAAGGGYSIHFNTPLRGTANTLIEIDEITATGTTGVLFDAQGFTAAE